MKSTSKLISLKRYFLIFSIITFFNYNNTNAQCTVVSYIDSITVNCGDSLELIFNGYSQPPTTFDFNSMSLPAGWQVGSSASVDYTNPCGPSLDGTASLWMSNASPRYLITNAMDVSNVGSVCFDLDFGGDDPCSGCTSCEDPDQFPEGVFFQYSIDGGTNWTNIYFFEPTLQNQASHPYYSWANYCFDIPPAAQTTNTMFRWSQEAFSGLNYDHWGLDNIEFFTTDPTGNGYDYYINGTLTDNDSTIIPTVSDIYQIEYTNGIDDTCSTSVEVVVDPFDPGFSYPSNNLCNDTVTVVPTVTGDSSGYFSTSPALPIDSISGAIDLSTVNTGTYGITYQSTNPSCSTDTTVALNITNINIDAGADTVYYVGDPITLTANNPSNAFISWSGGINDGVPFYQPIGTQNYIVYASLSGCNDTDDVNITVVDSLSITAIITPDDGSSNGAIDITITGGFQPIQSISWSNGATTEDISNLAAGNYMVEVTDSLGTLKSKTFQVPGSSAIQELESNQLKVTPNPSTGVFKVNVSGEFDYIVLDSQGKKINQGSSQNQVNIDLSKHESGIYILKILQKNQTINAKLIKSE